jgi:uncharacterized delta-60 repeat protein
MKKNYLAQFFTFLLLLPFLGYAQRPGDFDQSFNYGRENYQHNYGLGANNEVTATAIQQDGKILIGGSFTTYNGAIRNHIARLNPDGSIDANFNSRFINARTSTRVNSINLQSDGKFLLGGTLYTALGARYFVRLNADGSSDVSFNSGSGINGTVFSSQIQPDGKIIIGGGFSSYNDTERNNLARINSDGSLDTSFNSGTEASSYVLNLAMQPDGKIIIGGVFTSYNGTARRNIARLNANGSLDTSFNPGTGANSDVSKIAVQLDGKIIIGGNFTSFNGTNRNRIARLNTDGSLDTSFNPIIIGANSQVNSIYVQHDSKILIGGIFNSINGIERNSIARLNADGSLDSSFNVGTGMFVYSISLQPNGKLILGGLFSTIGGTRRGNVARLNADGTLDNSFNPDYGLGPNNRILTTSFQPNGKVIIAGNFTSYNNVSINRLARLNSNGSLDTSFNVGTGANNAVINAVLQPDGKIIIVGNFTSYNNVSKNGLARLNSNGSLDTSFNLGIGPNNSVFSTILQRDGKIIIAGSFTLFNGIARNKIARLNSDGSLDLSFNPGNGPNGNIYSSFLLPNDKIIIGLGFSSYNGIERNELARLNSDGSLDTSFNPGGGPIGIVETIALQTDGKLIIGGAFYSYNGVGRNLIARINDNGSLDTSFNPENGPFIWDDFINPTVSSIAVQPDGKIVIGGFFATYNDVERNHIARLNANGTLDTSFDPGAGASGSVGKVAIQPDGKIILLGGYDYGFTGYQNFSSPYIARIHGGSSCIAPATPTISGNNTFCLGGSTILTSSATSGNLWITGDTTRSITVNTAGNYSVRVISGACTSSISNPITVNVTSPAAPQIAFDSVGNRCLGSEIIVSVAGTYNQYRWNNGANTRSITVRGTGAFSAEVLDSTGCWSQASRTTNIVFDTAFCQIRISIVGIDSLEASIYADRYEWFLDGIQLLSGNNSRRIPIQGDGVYTVRAIIGSRNSALSNPITITSSKKSFTKTAFEVFPNPATDKVTIKTTGSGTLEILNTLGQVVITQTATETNELNLSKYAKGVYTVRFNGGSKILVVK